MFRLPCLSIRVVIVIMFAFSNFGAADDIKGGSKIDSRNPLKLVQLKIIWLAGVWVLRNIFFCFLSLDYRTALVEGDLSS